MLANNVQVHCLNQLVIWLLCVELFHLVGHLIVQLELLKRLDVRKNHLCAEIGLADYLSHLVQLAHVHTRLHQHEHQSVRDLTNF